MGVPRPSFAWVGMTAATPLKLSSAPPSYILPAMMHTHVLFAILIVAAGSSFTSAQSSDGKNPPTAAEAQAFIDRANAELLKLTTDASHAEWTAETDITDDTEATTALMNEQATSRALALGAES